MPAGSHRVGPSLPVTERESTDHPGTTRRVSKPQRELGDIVMIILSGSIALPDFAGTPSRRGTIRRRGFPKLPTPPLTGRNEVSGPRRSIASDEKQKTRQPRSKRAGWRTGSPRRMQAAIFRRG